MSVSHVHSVVPAEEKLPESRSRMLESHKPKLFPPTSTSETAVIAPNNILPPKIIVAGVNMKEALNAVMALFSIVRAKSRMLPSDGACVQATAVSLLHLVAAQMLMLKRALGCESAFEKNLPTSTTLELPLAL